MKLGGARGGKPLNQIRTKPQPRDPIAGDEDPPLVNFSGGDTNIDRTQFLAGIGGLAGDPGTLNYATGRPRVDVRGQRTLVQKNGEP